MSETYAICPECGVRFDTPHVDTRVAELEAEVERYKFMAISGVRTYDIQREAIAELEARLANAERYTP